MLTSELFVTATSSSLEHKLNCNIKQTYYVPKNYLTHFKVFEETKLNLNWISLFFLCCIVTYIYLQCIQYVVCTQKPSKNASNIAKKKNIKSSVKTLPA